MDSSATRCVLRIEVAAAGQPSKNLSVQVALADTVATVLSLVRRKQGLPLSQRLTLYLADRRLYEEDTVAEFLPSSRTNRLPQLQCRVTDTSALPVLATPELLRQLNQYRQRQPCSPESWVDPNIVLALFCAVLLAVGAVSNVMSLGGDSSRASWMLLTAMTAIYLLLFAPWPRLLPQSVQARLLRALHYSGVEGRVTVVHRRQTTTRPVYTPGRAAYPPRPEAPLRGPNSSTRHT
jgi:hypothetical protein